jgi:two-component system, response regulator PdtaR
MQPMYNDEDILIVEDDSLLNGHICEVLLELGFTVAGCASSGVEALSFVEQKLPALALVDIHLRGPMDGIELAQLLRERFGVLSIFLSGLSDDQTLERARAACPLGFLSKPFRPSQVFGAIDRALNHRLDRRSRHAIRDQFKLPAVQVDSSC